MAVHYKFKSAKNYDTIQFEGSAITVGELKRLIIEQKKLDKAKDFDLKFSNLESKEDYIKDEDIIHKNTSIIVRRVPILTRPTVSAPSTDPGSDTPANTYRYPTIPRPLIDARPPPPTYVCHRCNQRGHYINHCPTNGDTRFDKVKKSTGIPKTFLKAVEGQGDRGGALMTPGGNLAVLKHNSDPFDQLSKSMQRKQSNQLPMELVCPLCKGLMKEAVLTACCGMNFCNHCILRAFYDDPNSCCPNCKKPKRSADDLTPNLKIRSLAKKRVQTVGPEESEGMPPLENPQATNRGERDSRDSRPRDNNSRGSDRGTERNYDRRDKSRDYRHDPYRRPSPNR